MCEEFIEKLMQQLMNLHGRFGITEQGVMRIELPSPDTNVFAMTAVAHSDRYECSFPGGLRKGISFDIHNPETFSVYDEVDALVSIPEKLLEIFPDTSAHIVEGIKDTIHDHWRDPADVQEFIRNLVLNEENKSWD